MLLSTNPSDYPLPIIVAPMFLVSGEELVVAACASGVMAAFPLTNARSVAECDTILYNISLRLKTLHEKDASRRIAPWLVNMVVHSSYTRFDEELALIKKYQPTVVITALGSPKRVIDTVHNYGGEVWADVSSLSFAKKAAAVGVDALILLCAGAGGHTGNLSPFAFMAEVKDFFTKKIILSGGIADGASIRASQLLGASFAYMGTSFIATHESLASDAYKREIAESVADDIVTTRAVTGISANFLKTSLAMAGINPEENNPNNLNLNERYQGDNAKKAWRDVWSAGHGVGSVQHICNVVERIHLLQQAYDKAMR